MPYASQLVSILEDRRLVALINEVRPTENLLATRGMGDLPAFCPPVPIGSAKIEWDMRFSATGLLQGAHRDADVPLRVVPGVANYEFDAPVWRTKWLLRESDLWELRTPGEREGRYGERLITDLMNDGRMLADTTMEWAAWQMIAGSLSVDYPNASSETINYRMPAYLTPTADPAWSDTLNSDPLSDIQNWERTLRQTGVTPGAYVFTSQVYQYLMENARVRSVIAAQWGDRMVSMGRLPETLLGLPYRVYDGLYAARAYVGTAYTSGTSLVLQEAGQLASVADGDKLYLGPSTHANNPRATEQGEVASISAATITLDAALTNDFAVGDPVTWYRYYLPEDKFVILPMSDGQRWAEFGMCPSIYAMGENRIYASSERLPGVPLKHEVMAGVDGAPILYRQGRHLYADVA